MEASEGRDETGEVVGIRVLIACEQSQVVCNAFRAKGHEAYSCDLVPTLGEHPEWHYQIDVSILMRHPDCTPCMFPKDSLARIDINCNWDLIIAFVPCDHLAVSGARWFEEKRESGEQRRAIEFFLQIANAPFPRIAIENPIGIMSGKREYLKKWYPDLYKRAKNLPEPQIIQPWQFGHGETKATCLWLKNLPKLVPTNIVDGREARVHKMGPSEHRARDRAVTYTGIAAAFANQWGCL